MHEFPRPDYEPLLRYVPEQSPVVVDLSDNRNLWGSHPAALAVLQQADPSQVTPYPDPYGLTLRRAVSDRFGVPQDSVATGPGGTAVLSKIFQSVANSTVRMTAPGWPAVGMLARVNSQRIVLVPEAEALADPGVLVGDKPSIVYIASPNNPTGVRFPDSWIRAVQERTEAIGSLLILDEAYGEYARTSDDSLPQDLALHGTRTITVKTVSKAYGLAGLRVGYAIAQPDVILEIDKARGPFMLGQITASAAAAALGDRGTWLEAVVTSTKESRARLLDSLRHRGFSPPESEANFVFIPLAPDHVPTVQKDLSRMGVRPRPFVLDAPGGSGLRCTVGPWDQMQRLLDGLDHLGVTASA